MPAQVDGINLRDHTTTDEKLDRRLKLSDDDREHIRTLYFTQTGQEQPTMTELAKRYHVDRRLIQFILFPEREARVKARAKVLRREGRYYDKEKARQNMQNYRNYKRKLVQAGKLTLSV